MEHSFSNRLLLVSLFQGFSRLDFLDIVEKTPFDFQSFQAGDVIVEQSAESRSLGIVLVGDVQIESESADHSYRYGEHLSPPWVIQPQCLFGLHNRYTHTVRALSEVQVVNLSKQSVCRLLAQYPAFQINFYNSLCSYAQQTTAMLWQTRRTTVEQRFGAFLQRRSIRPSGLKMLKIRMEDLAQELGTTRLRVSQMLAELERRELITHTRGIIKILALEKL